MRNYHERLDKRMFDFPNFYNSIAKRMPHDCVLAEIGVAEGASAIYLAEAILNRGKKIRAFYFIDDLSYGSTAQLRILLGNVCKAGLGDIVEVIPNTSTESACMFPDNHFDFVFIDASHKVEWTKADIQLWYQKCKEEGGILAGHDYNDDEGAEVKEAVRVTVPESITNPFTKRTEPVLRVHATDKGLGVWMVEKTYYVKMKCY